MQWSREVIHRKRLFKEINMLLPERSTSKDTVWRTDKDKIVSWPKYRTNFYRTFGPICRKHRRTGLIFFLSGSKVWHISICLPVQSVSITTKVESSNRGHGEMYTIQHYVIKFVSDLRLVCGFLRFPPPIKLTITI